MQNWPSGDLVMAGMLLAATFCGPKGRKKKHRRLGQSTYLVKSLFGYLVKTAATCSFSLFFHFPGRGRGDGVSQLHKQINKLRGKQVGATENETDSESLEESVEESVEESESESEEESVELWELKAETKTEIAGATDDKRRKVQNSSCK